MPQSHRAEIDGLRAIAVLAVVFYHFGLPGVAGGFVGVDVFFVISGFLIGGILWREKIATGRLSLGQFYVRRIKRLAPAYVAMSVAVLVVGWLVLLPNDFRETAKGIIAATVYLSNVLFYRQSGYFDSAAEDKVMLHTWSLSVEEQFYLFLPLVFLLLGRSRRVMLIGFAALFLASLIASLPMTERNQPAAFYLFPFRAWELLAGVLLAVWATEKQFAYKVNGIVSYAGLAIVIGAILFVTPDAHFPGWQAIFPVLGTVMLIANGRHNNFVNRVLSMRVPVAIGLISYSLYLWHWPVFTLTTYVQGAYAGPAETALWITISVALAAASWAFVEQPVRKANTLTGSVVIGGAATASILLLGVAGFIFCADGVNGRFGPQADIHIAATGDFLQDFSRCEVAVKGPFEGLETCPIGPASDEPEILIWGDSHVRAMFEGLTQIANESGRPALVIWRAGCAPAFDLMKQESAATASQDTACSIANDQIRTALSNMPNIRDVILIGRWAYYATGQGTGNDAHNTISLSSNTLSSPTQDALFADALKQTVKELGDTDRHIFALEQPPEIATYSAPEVARALAHGRVTPDEATRRAAIGRTEANARAALAQEAVSRSGANLLPTWDRFCDAFLCEAVHEGTGQYFDNNHLTNSAARRIRDVFAPVFMPERG
ncbi:peptidoglycan/LPS O-acetylase OafA/YrhL [Shimia isoporae]|uniref:Peptidoglycan/LPS O-acetylase OafA/YrhL n=1 Tax=Shimia isoporae TaxID=647720 RepID=A0A4R1NA86_9RHOB|nr:acyltransferase family protein [Shimia isoporae]TCL00732.1 peptidoglycan/LPS O-acetylase OafA/YrhL [Shimia isoporae]